MELVLPGYEQQDCHFEGAAVVTTDEPSSIESGIASKQSTGAKTTTRRVVCHRTVDGPTGTTESLRRLCREPEGFLRICDGGG
jgi:hypothetical protein